MTPTRGPKRALLGLYLALVILAAVAVLAYRSIGAIADTLGWVEHTSLALREISEISSSYARASAARRSYVVAGDASQLHDVPELDARVARSVADLRGSLADNPRQLQRLETLSGLITERLRALDAAVERRRRDGIAEETAQGLGLTARVRQVREQMEIEENRLLAERDAGTRRDIVRTRRAVSAGTLASVAILLFVFGRLREEILRRRQSERALRANEKFLDSIVENIPDMVFVKEASELRFQRINRAGEQLLGLSRNEMLEKNDFDFFPREQAVAFQERDRETLRNAVVVDVAEEPIQTASGQRWLHTKKVPVLDEAGVPRYLLGISEDITERREASAAIKSAKDAAELANKELEAFSYSVAHDLRAPLRAIDGFSEALTEDCHDVLSSEAKGHLARIGGAAQQMGQLIDGLLGLSRVTRGELTRQPIDLSKIAEQSAARLREANRDRSVDVVVAGGLTAVGDARLLSAVFDNLLGNAWKFTSKQESARIEVGRRIEEGQSVFFVRDNGAGFEQAYAHKLFGAFQRLHTHSEFDGTGIGLATVQRIVSRHGGRIWAEGEVGRGATFSFTL